MFRILFDFIILVLAKSFSVIPIRPIREFLLYKLIVFWDRIEWELILKPFPIKYLGTNLSIGFQKKLVWYAAVYHLLSEEIRIEVLKTHPATIWVLDNPSYAEQKVVLQSIEPHELDGRLIDNASTRWHLFMISKKLPDLKTESWMYIRDEWPDDNPPEHVLDLLTIAKLANAY